MVQLNPNDALIIVDVQNDFLPGGNLGAPHGDQVVPVLNAYIAAFAERGLPVFATRDWHPPNHCSFTASGGIWPPHCVAGSPGAQFAAGLKLPENVQIVSKATEPQQEAYSGFEHTDLAERLRAVHARRLFIGGLATDYCVLQTVLDALRNGFEVYLLADSIRAVNVHAGDDLAATRKMMDTGARTMTLPDLAPA